MKLNPDQYSPVTPLALHVVTVLHAFEPLSFIQYVLQGSPVPFTGQAPIPPTDKYIISNSEAKTNLCSHMIDDDHCSITMVFCDKQYNILYPKL